MRSKARPIDTQTFVIPAQAGIHHRTWGFQRRALREPLVQVMDPRLCGNDEGMGWE
jgi:hypothetical protein